MRKLPLITRLLLDSLGYYLSVSIGLLIFQIGARHHAITGGETVLYVLLGGHLLFMFSVYSFRGYKTHVEFPLISEMVALLKGITLMLILSALALLFFRTLIPYFLTYTSALGFAVSMMAIPPAFRFIANRMLSFMRSNLAPERVLVYGAGAIGCAFTKTLHAAFHPRFQIIGFVDDSAGAEADPYDLPVLGTLRELEQIVNSFSIDRIFVAIRHLSQATIERLVGEAQRLRVKISFLPSVEAFAFNPKKLNDSSDIAAIAPIRPKRSPWYHLAKRISDIFFSIIGLVVMLPAHLVIAILIKRDSPGPVLFKQERVGLNGKRFLMYKYRTMLCDTPQYAHCPTNSNDERITKVGRWLRKLSIDEIPQFWNVLRGDMSIVGPRPEMSFIVDSYNEIERTRLSVKPGLTGLWQTSKTRNSEISHNLEYDFYYVKNQGVALDFAVMMLTLFFVFRGITH